MKMHLRLVLLCLIILIVSSYGSMSASAAQLDNGQNVMAEEQPAEEQTIEQQATEEKSTEEQSTEPVKERQLVMIKVISEPDKRTYTIGESLDLTGLVVEGYYDDGSEEIITDYQILGYDSNQFGRQTIIVLYKNFMDTIVVTVLPERVSGLRMIEHGNSNFTLQWNEVRNAFRYDIYCLDPQTGDFVLRYQAYSNSIILSDQADGVLGYKIKAVVNMLGIEYHSEFSEPLLKITLPDEVLELSVVQTSSSSIKLSWAAVRNATGYMVYRSLATTDDYKLVHTTSSLTYTDTGLLSGVGYKYKVCAYVYSKEFVGPFSSVLDTSTAPGKPTLKYKAGEGKVRLTWSAVRGATSYDIYIGSALSDFTLLTSISGGSGGSYIAENLTTGETYQFYIKARKLYNGVTYDGDMSDIKTVFIDLVPPTSNTPKLFPTEEDFYNSWSYQKLDFFSKYVNYEKSYAIPGLITTNVGGFSSNRMCPQGLTFASEFLLMSAYDLSGEENSVIYVVNKKTKELLTTLILPSKPHAGGLAFDGSNVWVTIGSRVATIRISDIRKAVKSKAPYVYIEYGKVISVGFTASYCAYYDEKLWVGTYDEIKQTNMYSYIIEDKYTDPKLKKKDTIIMPNRVQGVAFTNIGTLIISRSCQIHSGMRGYIRQLDVYKPDYSKAVDGVISLGKLVNSVSVPSMNEGIAIDGNYLYVTYETGAFEESKYKMDRITAFKLTDVVKKKTK